MYELLVAMRELTQLNHLGQARALLHPVRVELLELLERPRTCRELAEILGTTQQRLNHHLKELLKARLIRIAKSNQKGNLIEATYQRVSKAFWLSPAIVRGSKRDQKRIEELSLHNLLVMAETLQADVARLLDSDDETEIPSVGLDAEVVLRDEAERERFTQDVLRAFHAVAEKYQGASKRGRYKLMVSCYPTKGENL